MFAWKIKKSVAKMVIRECQGIVIWKEGKAWWREQLKLSWHTALDGGWVHVCRQGWHR